MRELQVEVTVTISPITSHHLNSTFALRVANSEGHQLYRQYVVGCQNTLMIQGKDDTGRIDAETC